MAGAFFVRLMIADAYVGLQGRRGLGRMVRKAETFPPVTMGHIRGHGCRDLLVYCGSADAITARALAGIASPMICRCGPSAGGWSAPDAV
jgi:hypothetical protein